MKKKLLLGILAVFITFVLIVKVNALEYKTYNIGQEIKFNPITGRYCTSGDNCMTFNVINTGENSIYYEMMLNYNLIADSAWGDTINGPTIAVSELKNAVKDWKGIETYQESIELPSSSGSYTINYSGSKARMITAEEVAAIYGYETVGGSRWVWNGQSTSNNIEFKTSNRWLAQNLGNQEYGPYQYGNIYNNVVVENGHIPFDYYTASATGSNNTVYTVQSFGIALDKTPLGFNDVFDSGLRPVVKLKKEIGSYTVSFDKGDGTGDMEALVVTDSTIEIPVSKFTAPKGKEFDYWLVGEEKLYPGDTYTIDDDVTLVAVYKDKKAESSKKCDDNKNKDNKTEETVKNPKTGDTLFKILGAITLAGAGFVVTVKKAKQK